MPDLRRIIWLASFPKSGNTWVRTVLAGYFQQQGAVDINRLHEFTLADVRKDFYDRAAGGAYRGTTFDDWLTIRQKALALIAGAKPTPHFVKTHNQIRRIGPLDVIPPGVTAAAIYILRNPFDVAPSYARHLGADLDTAIGRMIEPTQVNMAPTGIMEIVGRWDEHAASWLDAPGLPRHAMRYEDMSSNPERGFRELLGFLKVPVQDGKLRRTLRETRFDKLKAQEERRGFKERPAGMSSFFAKGQAGAWREDLSPAQVARLREAFLPALERHYPELLEETAAIAAAA